MNKYDHNVRKNFTNVLAQKKMFHIVSLHTYLQISWNTLHAYFTILSIAQTKCLYNTSHKQTKLLTYIRLELEGMKKTN